MTSVEEWGVRQAYQGRSSVTAYGGRADAERWTRQACAPGETKQLVVRRITTTGWSTIEVKERP